MFKKIRINMLEKLMHKVNIALDVAGKKDKKRILDSAKDLESDSITYVDEVGQFIIEHNMDAEKQELFLSELKKFHLHGKTILKLDIGIGEISTYQQRVMVSL